MEEQNNRVLRRFLAGLVLVIVLFGIIWFIFLRDSGKKESDNQNKGGTTQHASPEDDSGTAAQSKPASNSTNPQVGGAQTGSGQNSSGTDRLAATGPGNPAVLFAGAMVIGGAAHYAYTQRRLRLRKFM